MEGRVLHHGIGQRQAELLARIDIAAEVKSKGDLAKVQAQFNAWAEETGLPYVHLSRICAMSIGENHGPR